jgi:uracil DNA glycosylase
VSGTHGGGCVHARTHTHTYIHAYAGVLLLNACLTVRAHERTCIPPWPSAASQCHPLTRASLCAYARTGTANSHAGHGWEQLTDAVVRAINTQRTNVVFMLWGNPAQKKGKDISTVRLPCIYICVYDVYAYGACINLRALTVLVIVGGWDRQTRHLVLTTVHPSPLSASRGFFGCNHFALANEYLAKHGHATVDWAALRAPA